MGPPNLRGRARRTTLAPGRSPARSIQSVSPAFRAQAVASPSIESQLADQGDAALAGNDKASFHAGLDRLVSAAVVKHRCVATKAAKCLRRGRRCRASWAHEDL